LSCQRKGVTDFGYNGKHVFDPHKHFSVLHNTPR